MKTSLPPLGVVLFTSLKRSESLLSIPREKYCVAVSISKNTKASPPSGSAETAKNAYEPGSVSLFSTDRPKVVAAVLFSKINDPSNGDCIDVSH